MGHKTAELQTNPVPLGIGAGLAAAVISSIVGSMIMTFLLLNETVDPASVKVFASVIQFVSTVLAGLTACIMVKGKYALIAGITTLSYAFLLLASAVLLFDSAFTNWGTSMLAILLGYVVACVISIMRTGKRGNRKRTRR